MSVLVTKEAPDFTATAVMPDGSFNDKFKLSNLRGRNVILFFYPLDFTFVCPSEIIAFDHKVEEFRKRDCDVIGVSVDSHFTHLAWRNTPVNKGGIGPVKYPLVADLDKAISRAYDVLINEAVALRGLFLIDRTGVVRHQIVNDLPLGRNIDEALRMVEALQFVETHGEVCPANWVEGKPGMKPSTEGVADYLAQHAKGL
jgi:peroxiredoxin (alkyl hydroperoxide reductase subunit C)